MMPHHVLLIEAYKSDAFDAFQHVSGMQETASLAAGKVDLRLIASHHHFRIKTLTREDHFHLLARGVLRFIEDDEAIIERAPAHECQWGNLDHVALKQFFHLFSIEHIEQRIIERPEIGVYFLLERAGQKAEMFAGFHGWPRE